MLRLANVVGPTSTHGVIYDFVTRLSSLDTRVSSAGNAVFGRVGRWESG